MKTFKGRYWVFLLVVCSMITYIPSLINLLDPQVKKNILELLKYVSLSIVIVQILGSAFVVGESTRRIDYMTAWGKAFIAKDNDFIMIFRFSILHLIVFILNHITLVPINKGLMWCDKYLTIKLKNND